MLHIDPRSINTSVNWWYQPKNDWSSCIISLLVMVKKYIFICHPVT